MVHAAWGPLWGLLSSYPLILVHEIHGYPISRWVIWLKDEVTNLIVVLVTATCPIYLSKTRAIILSFEKVARRIGPRNFAKKINIQPKSWRRMYHEYSWQYPAMHYWNLQMHSVINWTRNVSILLQCISGILSRVITIYWPLLRVRS